MRRDTIRDFLRRLVKGGYLRVVREEPTNGTGSPRRVYRLVKDQPDAPQLRRDGTPAVRVGRANEQMWRTMKMVDRFGYADLAMLSSTESCRVTFETAKSYVVALHTAGYLKRIDRGLYRLRPDMNTGPLAPMVQRTDWVFDPNLKKPMRGSSAPEGGA